MLLLILIINTDKVFIIFNWISLHLLSDNIIIWFKKLYSQKSLNFKKYMENTYSKIFWSFFSAYIKKFSNNWSNSLIISWFSW